MTTPTDAPEVDNVFTSLYFEKIHIPEFVHGSCELAEKKFKMNLIQLNNIAKIYKIELIKQFQKIWKN